MASPAESGSDTASAVDGKVSWDPGHSGAWLRNFRLGEWLTGPVSPLFESWALTAIEERMTATYERWLGYNAPRPLHVVVNGWYYYGFNAIPTKPAQMLWFFVRYMVPALVRRPRRAALLLPPLAKYGVGLAQREWRDELQGRYRAGVVEAERALPAADHEEVVELIDGLLEIAGDYFTSITTVGGYAAKAEFALARFYRKELVPRIGGSVLELLAGLSDVTTPVAAHAVHGLDWADPPVGAAGVSVLASTRDVGVAGRAAARELRAASELRARTALAAEPRVLARFEALLADAQEYGRIREEQAAEFTLAWPILHEAALRLGAELVGRGRLARPEQVFDLRRQELLEEVRAEPASSGRDLGARADERRARRANHALLAAPLMLGQLHPMMAGFVRSIGEALRGDAPSDTPGTLIGTPASPGIARGPARIVHGPGEFDRIRPGDVLVSPTTTPAWTPLFGAVVAVVTDTGGIGAHASIVAREFGLPAVVGVEGATTTLADGQLIEVDGSAGVIRTVDAAAASVSG